MQMVYIDTCVICLLITKNIGILEHTYSHSFILESRSGNG